MFVKEMFCKCKNLRYCFIAFCKFNYRDFTKVFIGLVLKFSNLRREKYQESYFFLTLKKIFARPICLSFYDG
ncbi:hypothetical protein ASG31_10690 [Chryseobacterium sp. Leaf404]|nr:hypothetical protein ASG31_10690 [Chryseobacterium sp. Leaf404]